MRVEKTIASGSMSKSTGWSCGTLQDGADYLTMEIDEQQLLKQIQATPTSVSIAHVIHSCFNFHIEVKGYSTMQSLSARTSMAKLQLQTGPKPELYMLDHAAGGFEIVELVLWDLYRSYAP